MFPSHGDPNRVVLEELFRRQVESAVAYSVLNKKLMCIT